MKHRLLMAMVAMVAALVLSASATLAAQKSGGAYAASHGSSAPAVHLGGTPTADSDEEDGDQDADSDADEDHGDEDADEGNGDEDTGGNEAPGDEDSQDGTRPENHGWFVSQCAHDHSLVGREHGQAVAECAHSTDGKDVGDGTETGKHTNQSKTNTHKHAKSNHSHR